MYSNWRIYRVSASGLHSLRDVSSSQLGASRGGGDGRLRSRACPTGGSEQLARSLAVGSPPIGALAQSWIEETSPGYDSQPPRLLDRVRAELRLWHLIGATEKAYVAWIRRFVLFHGKGHPQQMVAREVASFLAHLAAAQRVSASTQNRGRQGSGDSVPRRGLEPLRELVLRRLRLFRAAQPAVLCRPGPLRSRSYMLEVCKQS